MPYLVALCDFYSQKPDLKQLLSWQQFMEDKPRAGITCIKLFCESNSNSFEDRQEYLRKAKVCLCTPFSSLFKEYFVEESRRVQDGKPPGFLSLAELNKYIRRIKIQVEKLKD